MSRYIALAHRGETGAWGISFPDFPGCISAADSFGDVVERGAEALRFHVEGLIEDGETIPEPRDLDVLFADPALAGDFEDAIVTVVPLLPTRDRPMRVNVILDANLLAEIDRFAEKMGFNRSEFLAEGARQLIFNPVRFVRAEPATGTPPAVAAGVSAFTRGERDVDTAVGPDPAPPRDLPKGHRAGQRILKRLTKGTKKG